MELIKIEEKNGSQLVSARELHEFLEVGTEFAKWCARMFEYGFEEERDFSSILTKNTTGRPSVDYALTLDCAKEIAMIQRTPKGKQAREYFIACEKKLKKPLSGIEILEVQLRLLKEQEKELSQVKEDVKELKAKTNTSDLNYFTIAGYASLIGRNVDVKEAAKLGRKATYICGQNGFITGTIPDPRFGRVKTYPKEVLEQVIK